jgi:hypothetical protein
VSCQGFVHRRISFSAVSSGHGFLLHVSAGSSVASELGFPLARQAPCAVSSTQPVTDFRHGTWRRFFGSSSDFGPAGHCHRCAPLRPPPGLIFVWAKLSLVVLAVVFPVQRFFSPLVFPVGRWGLHLHQLERVFLHHLFSLVRAESAFWCGLACSICGLWHRHRKQGAAHSSFSDGASSAFVLAALRSGFTVQVWNPPCCSLLASSTHLCRSIIFFFAEFSSNSFFCSTRSSP